MTARQAILLASTLFLFGLAATGSGQEVIDSIDVGCAWVGSLAHNPLSDVVYGTSEDGICFAISCDSNKVVARINLPDPLVVVFDSVDCKAYCTVSNGVAVFDGWTHALIRTIPMTWATLAVWDAESDRLYVSCDAANYIGVIDCRTDSIIATIPCPGGPLGMHINTLRRKLYVQNSDANSVSVIDMASGQILRTVSVGDIPEAGCYNAIEDLYFCGAGPRVVVFSGATDTVVATVGLPHGTDCIALTWVASTGLVMAGGYAGGTDSVFMIDAAACTLRNALATGSEPRSFAWSEPSQLVYCVNGFSRSVCALRSDGTAVAKTVPVGWCPATVALCPSRRRLYVGHFNTNFVYVIHDSLDGIAEPVAPEGGRARGLRTLPTHFENSVLILLDGRSEGLAVSVADVNGRCVRRLVGKKGQLVWDGRDASGKPVPPGVYFLTTASPQARRTKVVKL